MTGNWLAYLAKTFGVLLPIYGGVFAVVYAMQGRRGEKWRSVMEDLIHPIPILGAARRALALSRLAAALEALISAGVTIIEAWELAAAASGSSMLKRVVLGWKPRVLADKRPPRKSAVHDSFPNCL